MTDRAKQRAQIDQARQLKQQQAAADLQWLMADERGRRLMWGWLADAGVFRSTYTGEALSGAFNEGQRNAGLRLHAAVMQHCPEQFVSMLAESVAKGRAHKAEAAA